MTRNSLSALRYISKRKMRNTDVMEMKVACVNVPETGTHWFLPENSKIVTSMEKMLPHSNDNYKSGIFIL